MASRETDDALVVARTFFTHIFPHHGIPDGVIIDRDPRFVSKFWKSLMELCGVCLRIALHRHPQTDDASEIMNRMIEIYIRCFGSFHQDDWDLLLPSAEFDYNSAALDALNLSPFEVNFGWKHKASLDLIHKPHPIDSMD